MLFYEEFADKLLEYKERRAELLELVLPALEDIRVQNNWSDTLRDTYDDGKRGHLRDICPFTVVATFNRGISNPNRIRIAEALRNLLGVRAEVPSEFDGIPVVSNFKAWFFAFEKDRALGDIDSLWQVFEDALALATSDTEPTRQKFAESYDSARTVMGVGVNLTLGLYWIRPRRFLSLDQYNERYIKRNILELQIEADTPNGTAYLNLCDEMNRVIRVDGAPVATFPELSHAAWVSRKTRENLIDEEWQRFEELGRFDISGSPEDRRMQAAASALRQGQPRFRRQLLKAYDYRCAITGYDVKDALDACHIRTFPGKDDNSVSNGLLLRADIHDLFDAYLLGIDPDTGEVWIGKDLKGTKYAELEGKKSRVPEKPAHSPKADALRERWEKAKELGKVNW